MPISPPTSKKRASLSLYVLFEMLKPFELPIRTHCPLLPKGALILGRAFELSSGSSEGGVDG